MEQNTPASLGDALATEPAWLQAWVMAMVVSHLIAIVFVAGRSENRWFIRYEPLAILASFLLAAVFMNWLYGQIGYVRLLGVAHLVCWTPAWVWIAMRIRSVGLVSIFGKYLALYLVIAGVALVIDAVDVVRYLLGDGALLGRHT